MNCKKMQHKSVNIGKFNGFVAKVKNISFEALTWTFMFS